MADITKKVSIEAEATQAKQEFASVARTVGMVSTELAVASQRWTAVGKTMALTGAILTAAVVIPLTALAKAAVDSAVQFEQSMANVKAVSGAVGAEFDSLSEQAMNLGATTRYTATEAAEGMAMLGRAGWDAAETMEAMPGLLNLAAAGMVDLGTAADIVSDVMMAFGESADQAERYADVFAAAAANANTTVEALGQSMAYAAPSAATMGIAFEQTAAALSMFADAGIKGTRAGTTMDAMLRELRQNVQDGVLDFEHFSVAVYDQQGNMRDFFDIMEEIFQGMSGLTQEQSDYAASLVFSTRALRGFNVLQTAGVGRMREMESTLMSAESAGKDMAETMMDTLGGAIIELNSAIDGVRISFGNIFLPVLTAVVHSVTGLVRAFNSIPAPIKTIMVLLAAKTVAIILLTTVFGALLMVAGKLPPILAAMAIRSSAAATSMTALAGATAVTTARTATASLELAMMSGHFKMIARDMKVVLVNALRLAAAKMRVFASTILPRTRAAIIALSTSIANLARAIAFRLKVVLATLLRRFIELRVLGISPTRYAFASLVQFLHVSFIPAIVAAIAKVKAFGLALKAAILAHPIVAAIGLIIAALVALSTHMSNQLQQDFSDFSDVVDESTSNAVNHVIDMEKQITETLMTMRNRSGQISEEMFLEFSANMEEMAISTINSMERLRAQSVQALEEVFAYTGFFDPSEQQAIIAALEDHYHQQELVMIGAARRFEEIQEEIIESGLSATKEQIEELELIFEIIGQNAIDAATQTAEEAEGIRRTMRAREKASSAAHASEMIQDAWDRHYKEIGAIEVQYEAAVEAAEAYKNVDEEKYKELLAMAELFKNQRLAEEKGMHSELLNELRSYAGIYMVMIDETTGEITSLWKQMGTGIVKAILGPLGAIWTLIGATQTYKDTVVGLNQESERHERLAKRIENQYGRSSEESAKLATHILEVAEAQGELNQKMLEAEGAASEIDRMYNHLVSALRQYYQDMGVEITDAAIDEEATRMIMQRQQSRIISLLSEYEEDYKHMGVSLGTRLAEGIDSPSVAQAVSIVFDSLRELNEEREEANKIVEDEVELAKKSDEAYKDKKEHLDEVTEANRGFMNSLMDLGRSIEDSVAPLVEFLTGLGDHKDEFIEEYGSLAEESSKAMEENLRVEEIIDDVMVSSVDMLKTYETIFYDEGFQLGAALTDGFMFGAGVTSPSYIERILIDMEKTAKEVSAELDQEVGKINRLADETTRHYPVPQAVSSSTYETINNQRQYGSTHMPISIEHLHVRDEQDIERIAEELHRLSVSRDRGV